MDYQSIKHDFISVIGNTLGYDEEKSHNMLNFDSLFENWMSKKSWFIERMGGLIYEHPEKMTFRLSDEARERKAESFLEWVEADVNESLGWFLRANKDNLFENKVVDDCGITCIQVGMKIGRALRFFIDLEEASAEQVAITQEHLSMLIQEDKISGHLCLSVHPLDYLSLSENNHNWRSCHALDGEYRAGNLTYMVDDCTVIAYLKSAGEVKLPRFPESVLWNNKKWRCLFFIDKERDLVWAGRQYPFASDRCLDAVNDNLLVPCNMYKTDCWSPFNGRPRWQHSTTKEIYANGYTSKLSVPTMIFDHTTISMSELVEDHKDALHFNDLLHSSYYTPYFLTTTERAGDLTKYKSMKIGGTVICPICGETALGLSETMLCKHCLLEYTDIEDPDIITHCSCCGDRIIQDDEYWYNGEYYCESCYDSLNLKYCADCGEKLPADEMIEDENGNYYCSYCFKEHSRRTTLSRLQSLYDLFH